MEAAADGYDSSVAYSQAGSIKGISGYDDSTDTVAIKYGTFGGSGIDIDSSGNVGIGTTSPSVALDVAGSFKTSSTATLKDLLLVLLLLLILFCNLQAAASTQTANFIGKILEAQ